MHFVSVESPPIKVCNHLQSSNGYLLVYVINLYNDIFIVHIAYLLIWDVQLQNNECHLYFISI